VNLPFSSVLIYLLGFVGLASIGLIPIRVWQVLKLAYVVKIQRKILAVFLVLMVVIVFWCDVQITTRIFKCLTETYCGPSVASGWGYLAMLGVVYLIFEAVVLLMRKTGRPRSLMPIA
jgi:hypothetical protein